MNEAHEHCGSDEWREVVRSVILPWALDEVDLGDDVLEVGPGYGATTDVLAESLAQLTAVEIDPELAQRLIDRFEDRAAVNVVVGDATKLPYPDERFSGAVALTMLHHVPTAELQNRLFREVARVLRGGGAFVAFDGVGSPELEAHHEGDTYNPIDPHALADRLRDAGFATVDVKANDFGWASVARKP